MNFNGVSIDAKYVGLDSCYVEYLLCFFFAFIYRRIFSFKAILRFCLTFYAFFLDHILQPHESPTKYQSNLINII
jgi:hypothetical protein